MIMKLVRENVQTFNVKCSEVVQVDKTAIFLNLALMHTHSFPQKILSQHFVKQLMVFFPTKFNLVEVVSLPLAVSLTSLQSNSCNFILTGDS